jgi:hypothetical protein
MAYSQKTLKVNKREADIIWDSVYGRLVQWNNSGDKEKAEVLKEMENKGTFLGTYEGVRFLVKRAKK